MKSKTKRILAFLCAVVLLVTAVFTENAMNQAQAETGASAEETSTEPTPVELYGFQNVTLNGLVSATDNSVMTDKEYASGEYTYKLNNDTHFDKKLFTALVEFTDSDMTYWWNNRICIGGTADKGWGLSVALTNNGESLLICDADGEKIADPQINKTIEASKVGMDSFLGTEFILQMGYEYLDNNDVRVLVYVNGNEGLNTIVKNCNMDTLGEYVRVSISNTSKISINSVDLPVKPVELDGFTNVNPSDVVYEGTSNSMEETTYTSNQFFTLSGEENFNKKLFTAYVKPSNSGNFWDWRICLGGTSVKWGVALCVYSSGDTLSVEEFDSDVDGSSTSFSKQISAATANVDSFVTKPFLLQMGLEYLDNDGGGTENDVRVLIYVNGNAVFNEIFSNCNMNNLGNYLRFYIQNGSIEVSSFESEAKPVTLSSHDTITISDFQDSAGKEMEAKAYAYDSVAPDSTFTLKNTSDNFANKLLSMKVKFGYKSPGDTNYDSRMVIGADNVWSGIFVYVDKQDQLCFDNMVNSVKYERITIAEAGVSSFLNTPFILQLSFTDTSDGLNVDVFINGTLCKNFVWSGVSTSDYNNQIHLRRNLEDAFIIVSDADAEEFPDDPAIMPDPSFERITFGSFGFVNGTYNTAIDGIYDGSLDKKVLCGKVKFEGNSFAMIRLGGIDNSWDYGLHLAPLSADTMEVKWWKNGTVTDVGIEPFTSEIAKVNFMGSEAYDLMISMEVVDVNSDSVNDVRLGVWFDNKLYGDRYYDVLGVGDKLGNRIGITPSTDGTVTLNSVKEYLPQPSKDLQKVTFHQYGVEDGTYESAPDINVKGSYIDTTIAGTVLCGDVQLHNASAGTFNIFLGSTDNVWTQGVRLVKYDGSDNFTLTYQTSEGVKGEWPIESAKAGADFINEQFNLMWSMEMVDNDEGGTADDLKIGLWFDGFLYQGQYIYINGFGEGKLGNTFATYCPTGAAITLGSIYELTKLPDKDFDRITFSDFGLETQEVVCDGAALVATGTAKDYTSLDRVVFSGDFRFAQNDAYQIRYAGNGGNYGWNGLGVYVIDNFIEVSWFKEGEDPQIIVQTDAVSAKLTSTIKNTFNLMLSTELVDEDGDGIKDIKVGVWFNEILCDYQIVEDWGDQLGNGFGIYGANGNTVMIRNVGDYQKNPYYYEEIAEYRGETKSYPEEPGYVFSGWYEDPEYTTPIETNVTSGKAWAKYVEDDVLSVKAQVKLTVDSNQDGKVDSVGDETTLRVITTVDNLDYRRISFYLSKETAVDSNVYGKEINTATTDENARMVYQKLYAVGSGKDSEPITYKPTAFTWQSEYFKTFNVTGITNTEVEGKGNNYERNIKIVPYWITMDGTEVRGKELITCVADYGRNRTQAVSVDFIGDDTLPITGYNGPYVISDANDAKLFPNYITDEYFQLIAESGVNVIIGSNLDYNYYPDQVKKALKFGEKYGIGIYVKDSALKTMTANEVEQRIAEYRGYESFVGIFVTEEPGYDKYKPKDESNTVDSYASLTTILNKMGILTYVNMYPIADTASAMESWWGVTDKTNYTDYVNKVNSTLNPATLMWDYYPFAVPKTEDETSRKELKIDKAEYFWNMAEIRRQAQASDKPFWAYVQAGSNWNDEQEYFPTQVYAPTEGQFHWNMNTSLAFGAQGIQYFPLIQPYHFAYAGSSAEDKVWDFERNGLIGAFGNKTDWYYYAEAANAHVAAMDHILMNSYNEQIIALGDAATDTKDLINDTNMDVKKSASYKKLTSVSDGANVLIGCFDYKGKTALYVVNYNYNAEQNGIILNFDGKSNITKYENATETKTTGSSITLNMAAGEGILLVIE